MNITPKAVDAGFIIALIVLIFAILFGVLHVVPLPIDGMIGALAVARLC